MNCLRMIPWELKEVALEIAIHQTELCLTDVFCLCFYVKL